MSNAADLGGATPPASQHNPIYEHLVGDGTNPRGLIAYAIYKKMKREWIVNQKPSAQQIASYHQVIGETVQQLCLNQADAILSRFAQAVIEQSAHEYRREGANSEIVSIVKKQQNFWLNLATNVIGSIVFAVILGLFGLIYFSPNVQDFVKRQAATQSTEK